MEVVMKAFYVFQAQGAPDIRCITDDASGGKLPAEHGPWMLTEQVNAEVDWPLPVNRKVAAFGITENGYYLWGSIKEAPSSKPIIESDRVEGTAVFDPKDEQIGTIKRLLIEKGSGRVLYVDVTFGGFLGIGVHHRTIPWERLTYVRHLGGYRTDITAEQVRGAPAFFGDGQIWHDREREQTMRDYWSHLL
jgi:hypothetical protein